MLLPLEAAWDENQDARHGLESQNILTPGTFEFVKECGKRQSLLTTC